ncbi:hypothetical protein E4U53_000825 [Claviceps sorghi]|nr:hypothetical protein E4U53_000825 [Claviceps sorghi]
MPTTRPKMRCAPKDEAPSSNTRPRQEFALCIQIAHVRACYPFPTKKHMFDGPHFTDRSSQRILKENDPGRVDAVILERSDVAGLHVCPCTEYVKMHSKDDELVSVGGDNASNWEETIRCGKGPVIKS